MYDPPITSANTFNKANVCFGLMISECEPWGLDGMDNTYTS
jgi:hypothetical protein